MTGDDLIAVLTAAGPMSALELMSHMGMNRNMISTRVRRARPRIHIERYERQPDGVGGRCAPIYAAGVGTDAQPLKRLSRFQVTKRYRERHAAVISARRYRDYHIAQGPWAGLL